MQIRKRIHVSGIVQGVGFRPYVHRLATECHLTGQIANTATGVVIEVQGGPESIDEFLRALPSQAPPLAMVTALQVVEITCNGDLDFSILPSDKSEKVHTLIPPDIAVCDDCLGELFDPSNRRYLYPFINCTNCGPRFTIVRNIPYDRPQTSMSAFKMCEQCRAEYDDPKNRRRFHAQPNACWDCGPQIELWNGQGQPIASRDPLQDAAAHLREGAIVAIKGIGGFHLAVDAANSAAVQRLRERKHRIEKPFAVMVPDIDAVRQYCSVTEEESVLLSLPQRPIVILSGKNLGSLAQEIAPLNSTLGVFLPYTPLHHLLFAKSQLPALVMTSGNVSDEPIAIENTETVTRLAGIADFFLVHNRDILPRCDDSLVRRISGKVRHLRRSRGFVPVPVFLDKELPTTLAVGGELKNTICLLKDREAFLSQHIGDLENMETYRFFQETVAHFQQILEIQPSVIAYDLHPDYLSTRWALAQTGMKAVGVQHHHAHIASCMAENHLEGRVIGIALDGTGYGTDGNIWGGEILLVDYCDFERAAHFAYMPMPGGSAAIREPWRMAISFLTCTFGLNFVNLPIPFLQQIPQTKVRTILQMIERGVNSPLTSSCGRLFDAVAALIGLQQTVNYEGQAAIELEMCRDESVQDQPYPFAIHKNIEAMQIDVAPMFQSLVEDLLQGATPARISQRFHDGLVAILVEATNLLRQRTALNRICLSGGTFQNAYLLTQLEKRLRQDSFEVFSHTQVPTGDGGLSLGQAAVAAHRALELTT